jgi:hypothetical protein
LKKKVQIIISEKPIGSKTWKKTFESGYYDLGYCVQQTTDGGYIIMGDLEQLLYHPATDCDIWIIKTGKDGIANKQRIKLFANTILLRLLDKFPLLERCLNLL